MTNPDWYRDIESIMTCSNLSSVFLHSDIPAILSALRLQNRRLDRTKISEMEPDLNVAGVELANQKTIDEKKKKPSEKKEEKKEEKKQHISLSRIVKENVKIIQSNPNLSNELY